MTGAALFRVIPWAILLVPLALPAFLYDRVADEVLVTRGFFGGEVLFSPKSPFTVFRVPLIEIICAAAVETIRPKTGSKPGHFSVWNILLYGVAFKSLFQAFEFVSSSVFRSPRHADFFFYLTAAVVFATICLVAVKARAVLRDFRREDRKLTPAKKLFLAILLAGYLALAFAPALILK